MAESDSDRADRDYHRRARQLRACTWKKEFLIVVVVFMFIIPAHLRILSTGVLR